MNYCELDNEKISVKKLFNKYEMLEKDKWKYIM